RGGDDTLKSGESPTTTPRSIRVTTAVPSEADYARSVGEAVDRLRAKDFEKVVLARSLRLTGADPLDARQLLARLAEANPGSHVFAVDLGDERTLIGASPELLLSRFGSDVTTHPLAGSTPRSADPIQDKQRAEALLKSGKDLREHAYVVEAITATLSPLCKKLTVPSGPSLVATPTMWHLGTRITAEVADPDDPAVSALALATALHPTPAVCGSPADKAREAIAEYEPFDRGFYAGMVGWGDLRGDGEWAVTIRCGVVDGSSLTLYAGAGVVADSDPQAELAETSAKFRTLLEVLKG
ncbi:MAG TPA: isochorismate synthase, partial [Micromonosporaceae bacterium]|nr:isochorismate synthase [Micromonosporaceae bacterium]